MQLQLKSLTFVLLLLVTHSFAQTGIGTSTPDASAKLDIYATNKGLLPPRVTLTVATDTTTIPNPAEGLLVYNLGSVGLQSGYYYWNGTTWTTIVVAFGNLPTLGDVKTGIQSADHNGWIKLDGRLKTTLTTLQQAHANSVGIGSHLPDATNAVLMQSTGALGTIAGSMTRTLDPKQLPNIAPVISVNTIIGTMQNAGTHQHSVRVVPNATGGYAAVNPNAFKNGMSPHEADADLTDRVTNASYVNTGIISSSGDHSHTLDAHTHSATATSINGGVTQESIDITPRRLVVNTFIYLGL